MGSAETEEAAAAAESAAEAVEAAKPATPAAPITASMLPADGQEPSLIFVIIEQYEGEEQEGLPHGQGKARFAGRHKYEGAFSEGRLHGSGTYTWLRADGGRSRRFISNCFGREIVRKSGPPGFLFLDF